MGTITKKVTFGLELDAQLRKQAENTKGFVKFLDDKYFEVETEVPTDEDFVYVKRNNGENIVLPFKN